MEMEMKMEATLERHANTHQLSRTEKEVKAWFFLIFDLTVLLLAELASNDNKWDS